MGPAPRLGALTIALATTLWSAAAPAQELGARERFARGVALAAEGDPRSALIEFRAAYEATQNPEVLFNIAASHEQLNEYTDALDALERYQRLAPPRALARHRAEVVDALARLAQRVGTLRATLDGVAARCALDGRAVAADALAAGLRVSVGRRTLRCEAPGHDPRELTADVASGAAVTLDATLPRTQASLAVAADRAGAEVLVDGVSAGRTPLPRPLRVDEGPHRVEVAHPGYERVERVVEARGEGARVDAVLRWLDPVPAEVAARIVVRASEARASVALDGRAVPADGSVAVPPGSHRLRVDRADFLAAERDVELRAGETAREDVVLRPTPAYRDAYVARARSQRAVWRALLIGGSAVAVGGAVALALTLPPVLDANDRAVAAEAQYGRCERAAVRCANPSLPEIGAARDQAAAERDAGLGGVIASAVTLGVGLAGALVGAVLAADADPVDRFERPPVFRMAAAPGGLALSF